MSAVVIRVEQLGKQYHIGQRERARTLRDTLTSVFTPPPPDELIWALRDVSFEVKRGEALGIIGRNGAGKSTLLKILSRITEPTRGEAHICGRMGSLLEVGTGFHPELTGRENIFLNGAILGMKRTEIRRRFDQIVAFAEIEKFLDTPVKHYSSGMYLRLAFAVAAHLDPEILLVDEVLAVGDAEFQKKCLGRMGEVTREGRTVLFVSHNIPSIAILCDRALWLQGGALLRDGPASRVTQDYLSIHSTPTICEWSTLDDAPGNHLVRLRSGRILNAQAQPTNSATLREHTYIELTYWILQPGLSTNVGIHLYNAQGVLVFVSNDFHDTAWSDVPKSTGIYRSVCTIPDNFLNEGRYTIDVAIALTGNMRPELFLKDALNFELVDDGQAEVRGRFTGPWTIGVLRPKLEWQTTKLD